MTVSWESVITSLLGAVLGVLLGLLSGFLLVLALRDQGITVFSVPVLSTIVILIVSFIVGVIAAVIPRSSGHQGRHHRGDRHDMTGD